MLEKGSDACKTPRLNSKRFDRLIVGNIRKNILTESNIRDLVWIVDEETDGVAHEQRKRLKVIEDQLHDVKRRLGHIWQVIEKTDIEMTDAAERNREHRERKERLEVAAENARAMLAERRDIIDSADATPAFAPDLSEFLKAGELTETKAFVRSFAMEIEVKPGMATIVYNIPISQSTRKAHVLVGGKPCRW